MDIFDENSPSEISIWMAIPIDGGWKAVKGLLRLGDDGESLFINGVKQDEPTFHNFEIIRSGDQLQGEASITKVRIAGTAIRTVANLGRHPIELSNMIENPSTTDWIKPGTPAIWHSPNGPVEVRAIFGVQDGMVQVSYKGVTTPVAVEKLKQVATD